MSSTPDQGIDRVADVHLVNGKIQFVGSADVPAGADVVDLSGHYLSPGWVDIHVHAYGTLGFANPDSVGVYQGVTSFVDAGGPGIGVLDQFMELLGDLETSLFAGAFIRPMGLLGLNFIEGNVRTLGEVPITRWVDFAKQHRDMLRYIKCNAIGDYGPGTLKLTKGLAEILGLPLYMHIGEFQLQNPKHLLAPEAFRIAEAGDMITHLYHGNLGQVIDDKGNVLPVVRDAERRGVIFDLGFGGYNFSWDVAEKAFAQDLDPPHDQLGPAAVQCRATGQVACERDERHDASRHDAVRRDRARDAQCRQGDIVERSGGESETGPAGRHHCVQGGIGRIRAERLLHKGSQGRQADRPGR